ncbi:MAG TPA: hypothetical protein DCY27_01785 [Desulfobacterales bacterium]|nr:hypothetical protein [Desulfobacterales bacterium]
MKMTKHAKIRSQQRGISAQMVEVVMSLGEPEKRPGNALEYKIRKRDKNYAISFLKRLIQIIDKSSEISVIVGDIDQVLTVYRQN